MGAIKSLIARTTAKHAPSLFYYASESSARSGVRVSTTKNSIDIKRARDRKMIRISRGHALYVADLIDCFDYYHESVVAVQVVVNGVPYELVDFSRPMTHDVNGFSDFPILFSGLPEPMVTARQYLDFAELAEGGIAIDLGSYSALTSLVFAKVVGAKGKVLSLEPDPISFATAKTNVESYEKFTGIRNIELIQAAVMGSSGTLKLSSEGTLGSAATSLVGRHRGTVVDVKAYSLQDLADLYSLSKVDFIKIDIEGSEEEVIASSGAFFRHYRPRIIIEPHFVRGVCSSDAVTRLLSSYGYTCKTIPQIGISSLPLITGTPSFVHAARTTAPARSTVG